MFARGVGAQGSADWFPLVGPGGGVHGRHHWDDASWGSRQSPTEAEEGGVRARPGLGRFRVALGGTSLRPGAGVTGQRVLSHDGFAGGQVLFDAA